MIIFGIVKNTGNFRQYNPHMRWTLTALAAIAASFSSSTVLYTVSIDSPDAKTMHVSMVFSAGANQMLEMPNWQPGGYVLMDYSKRVQNFKVTDKAGNKVEFTQPKPYEWQLGTKRAGEVTAEYDLPISVNKEITHFSGPASYMYLVDRKQEPCFLKLNLPQGWKAACGLNTAKSDLDFTAKTYDVLADNPVTVGKYTEDHYTVRGKDHTICLYGAAVDKVDRARLKTLCEGVTTNEANFFGGVPYDKYVWHFNTFNAPDGAGGLEHLSSTEIGLSSGVGPGAVGVLSHEFFHLWNVKRIRAKVLGPFDYTQLPKTASLWWLEGVTDYYSHLLLAQNGQWPRTQFYSSLIEDLGSVRKNAAFKEVGPARSSMDQWMENNGRGNSNGYKLSYYELGWLAGLALDIEIRSETKGKKSLNDVEYALWDECKNDQPGFPEDEIRNQLVKVGGKALGPYYDTMIANGGLPLFDETLAKAGMELRMVTEPVDQYKFMVRNNRMGLMIRRSNLDGVMPFDGLVDVNGKSFDKMEPSPAQEFLLKELDANPADSTLTVMRGDKKVMITVPHKGTRTVTQMKVVENDKGKKLREELFKPVVRG